MTTLPDSEKRIHRMALWMGILLVIGSFIVSRNWMATVSVLIGTLLAWVNFRWLSAGVTAVVFQARHKKIRYLIAKFFMRVALIMLVLYVMIRTSPAAVLGFLTGLSVYILAVMAEAILSMFSLPKTRCTKKNFS